MTWLCEERDNSVVILLIDDTILQTKNAICAT